MSLVTTSTTESFQNISLHRSKSKNLNSLSPLPLLGGSTVLMILDENFKKCMYREVLMELFLQHLINHFLFQRRSICCFD